MVDPVLAQRAVLEALERKIDALGALNQPTDGITLDLHFWEDLGKEHPNIFGSATPEDVVSAISVIEKESGGYFKLLAIKPSVSVKNNIVSAAIMDKKGRPLDVSNLFWKIHYKEKGGSKENIDSPKIFWLTPRNIHSLVSGKKCSFSFKPNGVEYRLLEWFSENKEFTRTKILADNLVTNVRTISTEVADLRKKAEETFGLGKEDFIESSQGEGYKLNKSIKIKKE